MNKKAREAFVHEMNAFFKGLGAHEKTLDEKRSASDFSIYDFEIDVPDAGKLHLRADCLNSDGPDFFGCFEDNERGAIKTGGESNPHSGKWNFHCPWKPSPQQVEDFKFLVQARLKHIMRPERKGV